MPRTLLCLTLLLSLLLCAGGWAADLIQQVPTDAPAYGQLRQLAQGGMLPTTRESLFTATPPRALTRYDIGFLLIEPLQRLSALIAAQESDDLTAEQHRRNELATFAVSSMTAAEFNDLLGAARALHLAFSDVIDELSPGLSREAAIALRKLGQNKYRPWFPANDKGMPVLHISIDPTATPETIGNPLPLPTTHVGGPSALSLRGDGAADPSVALPSRPATSLEAAVDLALGRFRLYGSVATIPGQDPSLSLNPITLGHGKAIVGFQMDLARVKDLGISGLLEYHMIRSGEPGNENTDTGIKGGIGIVW